MILFDMYFSGFVIFIFLVGVLFFYLSYYTKEYRIIARIFALLFFTASAMDFSEPVLNTTKETCPIKYLKHNLDRDLVFEATRAI